MYDCVCVCIMHAWPHDHMFSTTGHGILESFQEQRRRWQWWKAMNMGQSDQGKGKSRVGRLMEAEEKKVRSFMTPSR